MIQTLRRLPLPRLALLLLALLLHGCSSTPTTSSNSSSGGNMDGAPSGNIDFDAIPDAVPRNEPFSRYGNKDYTVFGKRYRVMDSNAGFEQRGLASWYGTKYHGRKTSSGEVYDMYTMTAAHPSLPLPTYAEVTNLKTGKRIVVKINDRGPFHGDRVLDLSYAAAGKLGILRDGVAPVHFRAIDASYQPAEAPARRYAEEAPRSPVELASAPAHSTRSSRAPAPVESLTRPSAPTLVASSDPEIARNYVLQVGSFDNPDNAHGLSSSLAQKLGQTVQVRAAVDQSNTPVFQVQIGPLDREQAKSTTTRLAQLGYTDARLIIN